VLLHLETWTRVYLLKSDSIERALNIGKSQNKILRADADPNECKVKNDGRDLSMKNKANVLDPTFIIVP
jgi:hypothetical protein